MNMIRLICPNCSCPILFTDIQVGEKIHCSVCHKSFRPRAKHHETQEHDEHLEKEHRRFSDPPPAELKSRGEHRPATAPPEHPVEHPPKVQEEKHPPAHHTFHPKPVKMEIPVGESTTEGLALLASNWAKLRTLDENGRIILKGFACLGAGILMANFPYVDYLVIPLGLLGLFFGLQAFRETTATPNKRWAGVLMGSGAVFTGFVLCLPGVFRNLPNAVGKINPPNGYESTVVQVKPVEDLPWLDPRVALVSQGIKLQVKECAIRQYRPKNFTGFEKKSELPPMVHFRISLTNESKVAVPFPGISPQLLKAVDFKGDELPVWVPKNNPPANDNPKGYLDPDESMEFQFYFNPRYLTQNLVRIQMPGILFGFPNPIRFEVKDIPKIKE